MDGQNILDIEIVESENYTYVYPATLEMLFPVKQLSLDVLRERPTAPLRERDENERARLLSHPLFVEEY